MNNFDNPFHDLWLTEILNPKEFVQMFSPKIVEYSEALFGTGNVVVRGRQGSGKSMLLRLLDTNTRIAYAMSRERSPIPKGPQFFCSSVNLTSANISAMSSRMSRKPDAKERVWAAKNFSDILNYSLALDMLYNLSKLWERQQSDESLRLILATDLSRSAQLKFCEELNSDNSWYGVFHECRTVEHVLGTMRNRLDHYRAYFNFNLDHLDTRTQETTTEVGEPLSKLADSLRASGVIPDDCLAYFKIDQHEELFELEAETGLGDVFRQIINKALARRDHRSAYRIGTRHYSWSEQVKIWGTSAHLEDMRDYTVVDIDRIFRRPENPKIGDNAFRGFAQDVFQRRMSAANLAHPTSKNHIRDVFGVTPRPAERARAFRAREERSLQSYPRHWAQGWKELFVELREKEPLDSKLGEAWLRQRAQSKLSMNFDETLAQSMPWKTRTWWKKERNEVALMQLASESGQNLTWAGEQHIVALSGGNILTFMSICRTIWSGWLRQMDDAALAEISVPKIGPDEQKVGIYEASKLWVDKLREGQDGEQRRELVLKLGEWFSRTLREDKALSNPGHNGFSLRRSEFEKNDVINRTIRRCRDYGDLIESRHTSKTPSGDRIKWYLNPILCPYFGLPHVRTKEPIYTDLNRLRKVLAGSTFEDRSDDYVNPELFD